MFPFRPLFITEDEDVERIIEIKHLWGSLQLPTMDRLYRGGEAPLHEPGMIIVRDHCRIKVVQYH